MKFNFGNALATALIATAWLAPAAFAQIQKFEGDWKTSNSVPFSQPLLIKDTFSNEEELAVVDQATLKNYYPIGELVILTYWNKKQISMLAYIKYGRNHRDNMTSNGLMSWGSLEIKVGNKVFKLEPNDKGDYLVTPELATALKNAPAGKALMRLSVKQDANQQFTTEIGEKTVAAWKVIYQ